MKRLLPTTLVLLLCIGLTATIALARGFGGFSGGFSHSSFSGGFDRSSSFSSFDRGSSSFGGSFDRSSSFGGSFDRSSSFGGSSGGGFDRSSSYGSVDRSSFGGERAGGYSAGGFRTSAYGESASRSQLGGFLGLPTDGGMHAASGGFASRGYASGADDAAAWRGGASGHVYEGPGGTTVAHASAGERGAAVGPYGAAAGGRYASGTVVKGPEGNVYAHGTTAAYGTRAWSPTYCHAQAVACNGWCAGRGMYTGAWCVGHPWAWCPAGYAAADWATAAWATVGWGSLGDWIGCANATPYGYNYGNDIVYENNNVYYAGQPAGTAQQYYQGAVNVADSAPAQPAQNPDWLPLGVFGLVEEGKNDPSMVFQLAVDRSGTIHGNYFDPVTQTNQAVSGAVDKKTQRVAWRVAGGKGIVVETGLYNLTTDDSTALVHFGPDRTEQELLVRMKQPPQGN